MAFVNYGPTIHALPEPMMNFALARENMIESQVRPNGITDRRIIAAMAFVAREDYVGEGQRPVAYADGPLPLPGGRALTEPMALARLIQLGAVGEGDRVLHVGCATGYGTAVLAQLAGRVVALECDAGLAARARAALAGLANVKVEQGDLAQGSRANAPFDVILVEGRVGVVPQALIGQLAEDGRLVAVTGEDEIGKATLWTRSAGTISSREAFDASVDPLPGFARQRAAFVF
jgi:protein-L-isoaspartate(D-aspartate) O-methyltransferase